MNLALGDLPDVTEQIDNKGACGTSKFPVFQGVAFYIDEDCLHNMPLTLEFNLKNTV